MGDVKKVWSGLKRTVPASKVDLKNYVKVFLGIDIPDKAVCDGHSSPMDYLWYSFGSDFERRDAANSDSIVWANRGGGKTMLAAVKAMTPCPEGNMSETFCDPAADIAKISEVNRGDEVLSLSDGRYG